ncbi:hypothetical protein ARMGADRAFT_1035526 [Armillaria gallica]|uniref:Uncharacterized protein n=1 Tax=Armillaria gallica TaxID=47427 RepID=A0A2H3CYW1_ARMGA|nr:hypothetical protein ARMGADRAFT_1035526 [Armillaria gallica]
MLNHIQLQPQTMLSPSKKVSSPSPIPSSPLSDAPTAPAPPSSECSLICQFSQSFVSHATAANAPMHSEPDIAIPFHITGYVHSSDIKGVASLKKLETVMSHNLRVADKKADDRFVALEKLIKAEIKTLSMAFDHDSVGIDTSKHLGKLRGLLSEVQSQVKGLRNRAPDSQALREVDLRIEELHAQIDELSSRIPAVHLLDNLFATIGHLESKIDEVDSRAAKMDVACHQDIKDLAADMKGLDAKVQSCSKTLLATTDVVKEWHEPS